MLLRRTQRLTGLKLSTTASLGRESSFESYLHMNLFYKTLVYNYSIKLNTLCIVLFPFMRPDIDHIGSFVIKSPQDCGRNRECVKAVQLINATKKSGKMFPSSFSTP